MNCDVSQLKTLLEIESTQVVFVPCRMLLCTVPLLGGCLAWNSTLSSAANVDGLI